MKNVTKILLGLLVITFFTHAPLKAPGREPRKKTERSKTADPYETQAQKTTWEGFVRSARERRTREKTPEKGEKEAERTFKMRKTKWKKHLKESTEDLKEGIQKLHHHLASVGNITSMTKEEVTTITQGIADLAFLVDRYKRAEAIDDATERALREQLQRINALMANAISATATTEITTLGVNITPEAESSPPFLGVMYTQLTASLATAKSMLFSIKNYMPSIPHPEILTLKRLRPYVGTRVEQYINNTLQWAMLVLHKNPDYRQAVEQLNQQGYVQTLREAAPGHVTTILHSFLWGAGTSTLGFSPLIPVAVSLALAKILLEPRARQETLAVINSFMQADRYGKSVAAGRTLLAIGEMLAGSMLGQTAYQGATGYFTQQPMEWPTDPTMSPAPDYAPSGFYPQGQEFYPPAQTPPESSSWWPSWLGGQQPTTQPTAVPQQPTVPTPPQPTSSWADKPAVQPVPATTIDWQKILEIQQKLRGN